MKKLFVSLAAATLLAPAAPALAAPVATGEAGTTLAPSYSTAMQLHRNNGRGPRYDRQGRYVEPQRVGQNDRIWVDDDGRYRCRRSNGTTGLIIGGAVGALAGRAIDTRGDRTVGTLLGAAGGAVLGREIDRGGLRCR